MRREVGEIGEDIVTGAARSELLDLGHADLARAVRRVSLISDQLGYDVVAPRVGGPNRLLEVKATTGPHDDPIRIHLSRNEAAVGARRTQCSLS